MIKKYFFSLLIVLVVTSSVVCTAQGRRGLIGAGVSFGVVTYQGELDDHFALKFSHVGYGVHGTMPLLNRLHLRLAFFRGKMGASDADATLSGNRNRNLNFTSEIDELSLTFMYKLPSFSFNVRKRKPATPYIFAGLGGFYFDPQAVLGNGVVELQPLGTEGQYLGGNYPAPYSLFQFNIPFGAGFSFKLSEKLELGVEIGFRKTFTDYLDDVSGYYPDKVALLEKSGPLAVLLCDRTLNYSDPNGKPAGSARGNPNDNDWYEYSNIHLTYYLESGLVRPERSRGRQR